MAEAIEANGGIQQRPQVDIEEEVRLASLAILTARRHIEGIAQARGDASQANTAVSDEALRVLAHQVRALAEAAEFVGAEWRTEEELDSVESTYWGVKQFETAAIDYAKTRSVAKKCEAVSRMIDAAIRMVPALETTREGIRVVRRIAYNLGNLTAAEGSPLFAENAPIKGRAAPLHKARLNGAILAFCRFFEPLGLPVKEAQEKIGREVGGLTQTAVEHIERRARVSLEGAERSKKYQALELGYHEARSRLNVYRFKISRSEDAVLKIRRVYKNMFMN